MPLLKFTGRSIGALGYLPLLKTPKSKSREVLIQFVGALLYTPNFLPVVPHPHPPSFEATNFGGFLHLKSTAPHPTPQHNLIKK